MPRPTKHKILPKLFKGMHQEMDVVSNDFVPNPFKGESSIGLRPPSRRLWQSQTEIALGNHALVSDKKR
jgi:hypothetical protein